MLANLISLSRIFLAFLLVFTFPYRAVFVANYVLILFTDIIDGYVARKKKTVTKIGKRLDVFADNIVVLFLGIVFYIYKQELLLKYIPVFGFVLLYYLIVQVISKLKTGEFMFMRTYASLTGAVVFPVMIFVLLLTENKLLLYLYTVIMLYSLTEKIMLKLVNKEPMTIFKLNDKKLWTVFVLILFFLISLLFFLPLLENKACFQDGFCVNLEVRDTAESRALGLMFREHLDENQGMLFIFDTSKKYTFWMKNMKISIDMLFLSENNEIVHIVRKAPPCTSEPCDLYAPSKPARYVIEVQSGFSERHNLSVGQHVDVKLLSLDMLT